MNNRQPMLKVRVLVFDIDLTICDNSERKRKAVERALGRKISELEWSEIKWEYGFEKILDKLGVSSEQEKSLNDIMKHFLYDVDLFELDKPFGKAVEILNSLDHKYEIYYLTGRPIHQTAVAFIEKYAFPKGDIYSTKAGLGESYKKITLLSQILRAANVTSGEVVSIADLKGDAQAAKEVGVTAIGTYQAHQEMREELQEVCDEVIGDIRELPEALMELSE